MNSIEERYIWHLALKWFAVYGADASQVNEFAPTCGMQKRNLVCLFLCVIWCFPPVVCVLLLDWNISVPVSTLVLSHLEPDFL